MDSKESADWKKPSIRSWILEMGWKEWGILLLLGILLLVAGLPVSRKTNKTIQTQSTEKTRLESRLEELLSGVEGVGKVEVIIMTGDEGNDNSFSMNGQISVTGVLVSAEGAGSAVVVQDIQQAIWHYFKLKLIKLE